MSLIHCYIIIFQTIFARKREEEKEKKETIRKRERFGTNQWNKVEQE